MDPTTPASFRRKHKRRSWPTVAVLAVGGLLLATSAHSSHGSTLQTTSHDRLADLVTAEQRQLDQAAARQRTLTTQVDALTAAKGAANAEVAAAQGAATRLAGLVGLDPVHGPAYTVSLDDAPRDAPVAPGYPAPQPDDLVVHQQDVQAVVNALWAGGAEAMAIMGQRVVATSAVRCVGNTLLLQGRVYSPPFVVTAIGDPARMATAVDHDHGVGLFRSYAHAYGLRLKTTRATDLTLPGYAGPVALTHARPLENAGR